MVYHAVEQRFLPLRTRIRAAQVRDVGRCKGLARFLQGRANFFAIQEGQAIGLDRLLTEVGGDSNHRSVMSQALAILHLYIAKRDIIAQETRSGPHA